MQQVQVDRGAIGEAKLVEREAGPLGERAVRLAVESFSVTSNNVTYAVMGDAFGYWNFFPAPDGRGIVPMWGHASVVESNHPDIAVGERVYGYLPMASALDVVPDKVLPGGFVDSAEHRQPMSPVYNQYTRLAADPEHDPAREGERMIFGPLFKTGFLIESFMRRQDWFGATELIVTSASSKTAMGLASVAKQRSAGVKRIGLTSAGNVDFVQESGLYDEVIVYEDAEKLSATPSVVVDFAGNAAVLRSVHECLGDALKYSCLVGATHFEERGAGAEDLPGPQPVLFFAPDHAVALYKEFGPEEVGRQLGESWRVFLDSAGDSVTIERRQGLAAARDVFVAMARGEVDPAKGIVIEP